VVIVSPRTSRTWVIAVVISEAAAAEKGLSANPARMASGTRIDALLPELWYGLESVKTSSDLCRADRI
jgi:hypothetical protein